MDITEIRKINNEIKKYNIQDLALQYFIMEKKIMDEKETHQAKIMKYNMIQGCIHNEIQNKQQIQEIEKMESETSEEESETSDEMSIKSNDIKLLSEDDDEE